MIDVNGLNMGGWIDGWIDWWVGMGGLMDMSLRFKHNTPTQHSSEVVLALFSSSIEGCLGLMGCVGLYYRFKGN